MSRTLQPEDRIAHYKIIGPLGAGGMGEVYLAHDETLERDIALKVLPAEIVRSEDRVKRFVMEAKSASSLSHPHIVTIYEIGHDRVRSADGSEPSEDEVQYIAMELIRGKTLKDLIHQDRLDLKTLLGHLAQAAEGLSKAHAAGIIHRDLKPGNIMVTTDGYAKVLDFGLAKLTERASTDPDMTSAPTAAGDLTGAGVILGTLGYMSPEQVKGKSVDHRSDVFSFGCILYEAATRTRPFAADSGLDSLHKIVHDQPEAVDNLNPQAPADLRRLIRRCLAKNPDQRLQSIKDLAIELREIVDEYDALSASATSGSALSGPAPAPRRNPAMTAGIVAAVILGLGGIAFGVWSMMRFPAAGSSTGRPFQSVQMRSLMSDDQIQGAVLSPDGRYLAYIKGPAGHWSLWVRQVATGSDVEVLKPQAIVIRGVSFSPDGNYIYYLGRDTETPLYSALFEIPSLGGEPRKRIFDIDSAISFSPDGKRAAFVRGMPQDNVDQVMIADLGTGQTRVLAKAMHPSRFPFVRPAWSPDGSMIAAYKVTMEGGYRAALSGFHAETGEEETITEPAPVQVGGEAGWLPDGSGLIGTRQPRPGLSDQVFYFPWPPGEPVQITNDLDTYQNVSVTSDGSSIGALRTSIEQNLWIVAPEGGPPRQVTARSRSEGISDLEPLANGRIAFAAMKDRHKQIWSVEPDGTGRRQITDLEGWSFDLRPLPGGAGLVFTHFAEAEGIGKIWRVDLDGGNLRRLTDGPGEFLRAVSPDGKTLLTTGLDRGRGIGRVPADGGDSVAFIPEASDPDYSPDGKLLVYTIQREIEGRVRSVWQVIPADGGEILAEIVPPGDATVRRWLPDGSGMTYLHIEDGVQNIWKHAVGGKDPGRITGFTEGRIGAYAHSPDGSTIAVVRMTGGVPNLWIVRAEGNRPAPLTDFPTGQIFEIAWKSDGDGIVLRQGDISREVVLISRVE